MTTEARKGIGFPDPRVTGDYEPSNVEVPNSQRKRRRQQGLAGRHRDSGKESGGKSHQPDTEEETGASPEER